MDDQTIDSQDALDQVETIVDRFEGTDGIYVYWSWGYGPNSALLEQHRWHAGQLCCYWTAPDDRFAGVKEVMDRMRASIEALEIVSVTSITETVDELSGFDMRGEEWGINFAHPIVYTHYKDDSEDGGDE